MKAGTITVTGAALTYTSNNTSVATVNASTGAVKLTGTAGTSTITATYAGNDSYKGSSATYTITVAEATTSVTPPPLLVQLLELIPVCKR